MPRGGKRIGAGRKKSTGPSATIRVPQSLKDSIRKWIRNGSVSTQERNQFNGEIISSLDLLQGALTLKANAGGKIKTEIRKTIEILQNLKKISF